MNDQKYKQVNLFVDGSARGNPGKAGAGYVVTDLKGKVLSTGKRYLGDRLTNNQSEYKAVIFALDQCRKVCQGKVFVHSDSELLVKQMQGSYQVRNSVLKKLHSQVKEKEKAFDEVKYKHVKRELNEQADQLANDAVDEFQR